MDLYIQEPPLDMLSACLDDTPTIPSCAYMQAASLRFAAWMPDIDLFDDGLFRLSQTEAVGLDPQCRRLLENVYAASQVCVITSKSSISR